MKVSELIEELKKMPQDYEALDCCGEPILALSVDTEFESITLDVENDCDCDRCSADACACAGCDVPEKELPSHPVVVGAEAVFTLDKE